MARWGTCDGYTYEIVLCYVVKSWNDFQLSVAVILIGLISARATLLTNQIQN